MRKTILITGASSGIGEACVITAAALNFNVIATARRHEKLLQLQQNNNNVQIISADISTENGRSEIIQSVNQPIDYLLHNAARLDKPQSFNEMKLSDFQNCIATNAEPIIFLTQGLLAHLKQSNSNARILSISSGAAKQAITGAGNYCISKAAGLMANHILKAELEKDNILVNDYFPGHVDTQMQKTLSSSNEQILPLTPKFKSLQKDGGLSNPLNVASHIMKIFTNCSDNDFANNDWIYQSN